MKAGVIIKVVYCQPWLRKGGLLSSSVIMKVDSCHP